MNTKSVFTSFLLAGMVGLCFAAPPATAKVGEQTYSETIRYRDLDLSKAQDAQALLRRIRRAATMVCTGSPHLDTTAFASRDARKCIKLASSEAVAKVNHPVVTALYDGPASPVQIAKK